MFASDILEVLAILFDTIFFTTYYALAGIDCEYNKPEVGNNNKLHI